MNENQILCVVLLCIGSVVGYNVLFIIFHGIKISIKNKKEKRILLENRLYKLERGLEGFTGSLFTEGIEDRLLRVENQIASVNSWRYSIDKLVPIVEEHKDKLDTLKATVKGLDSLVGEMGNLHGSWEKNIEKKLESQEKERSAPGVPIEVLNLAVAMAELQKRVEKHHECLLSIGFWQRHTDETSENLEKKLDNVEGLQVVLEALINRLNLDMYGPEGVPYKLQKLRDEILNILTPDREIKKQD